MFITKLFINAKIPIVRQDLSNLENFYQTLKKISGGGAPVYRIDNVPLDKTGFIQPVIFVSGAKPVLSLSGIPDGYISGIESSEYNVPVKNGMVYRFLLRANPSVKVFFKYLNLDTDGNWREWLNTEGKINGFEIIDVSVKDDGYITSRSKNMKFLSVLFQGILKVTDEDNFKRCLHRGMGRGKEYGLGLMSVENYSTKNRNIAEEMKNSIGTELQ